MSGDARLMAEELTETVKIARGRILVKRFIGKMKKWLGHDPLIMICDIPRIAIKIKVMSALQTSFPP